MQKVIVTGLILMFLTACGGTTESNTQSKTNDGGDATLTGKVRLDGSSTVFPISDASRSIKSSEIERAVEAGISFIELPVAFDGLSIVTNSKNDWADMLTVAELKMIWEPGSKALTWPDEKIKLYGPGTDSGTFDYFTKAINGKEQASRSDFTASEVGYIPLPDSTYKALKRRIVTRESGTAYSGESRVSTLIDAD